MISRIWHGWTSRHNAEAYEKLLRGEIFAGSYRSKAGYRGIHLLRRDVPEGSNSCLSAHYKILVSPEEK